MVRVFGGKDSRICHSALRWMEKRDIFHQFIDIESTQIEEASLGAWIDAFGWRKLIDKRTAAWRNQPADAINRLSPDEARALIIHLPNMLKMPIIGAGDRWLLGWNAPNKVKLLGLICHNSVTPQYYSQKIYVTQPAALDAN